MNEINLGEKVSKWESPIYDVKRIKVWDIVGQSFNPNSLSSKAFSALQISIFNTGYAMSISGAENPVYDEEYAKTLTPKEKIDRCIEGAVNDAKSGAVGDNSGLTFATQVSDDNIRKAYKWQVIDGSQRSGIIRMGTKLFMEDPNIESKVDKWLKGEDIPSDAGKEMLKYLAWREDFSVPVAIIKGKTDAEMMSATILFNTARGSHSLDSMKDIVANLINVAGMSEEWVAKNLFLDIESVKRMTQLSGLKSAFDNIESADLSWNPESDKSYERKQLAYLNREAAKYVTAYIKEHPDFKQENRDMGDILDYAGSLGWDRSTAEKIFQGK